LEIITKKSSSSNDGCISFRMEMDMNKEAYENLLIHLLFTNISPSSMIVVL
jgi:hypothetical protein